MKRICFLVALMGCLCGMAESGDTLRFETIVENGITSVKDQNKSGTCWAFSSLSFFESEILRKTGREYDLCESFLVYKTMIDRAHASVRMHGDISFSQGGSFYDAVYCMVNYGMCPQDAMPAQGSLYGDTLFDHNELDQIATAYVESIAKGKQKQLSSQWDKGLYGIYDSYLGEIPTEFEYEGVTYTPLSFAESLGLDWDDYVSLTSFTHHPYYTSFAIEVQDNWRWGLSYNLPLDEFMEVMDNAIREGYTFAWGADVSEPNFSKTGPNQGVATVPMSQAGKDAVGSDRAHWIGEGSDSTARPKPEGFSEPEITAEMRQEGFDNWTTTDDHGMLIYGLAKDQNGKEYFMMKNSWGDYNQYHGCAYISKAYVAYKTMNILVHKDALPKAIRKKLGI